MYDRTKEIPVSKGFGYLNFKTQEEADRCIGEMQGAKIDKNSINLSFEEFEDHDEEFVLKAQKIPLDYDFRRIRSIYEEFGNIKSCKLYRNKDTTSSGVCFLEFKSKSNAVVAVDNLNLTHHGTLQEQMEVVVYAFRKEAKKIVKNNFNNERWGRKNWLSDAKAAGSKIVEGFKGQRRYLRGGDKTEGIHGFQPSRKAMIADNSDNDEADHYTIDPKVREKNKIGREVKAISEDIKKFRGLVSM